MIGPQPIDYDLQWSGDKALLITSEPESGTITTELTRLKDDTLNVSPDARR